MFSDQFYPDGHQRFLQVPKTLAQQFIRWKVREASVAIGATMRELHAKQQAELAHTLTLTR